MRAKRHEQAIKQLELAQRLAPRDIFLLRNLGKGYLDAQQPDKAADVLGRIESLDAHAFTRNVECAALKGRWLRENKSPRDAVEVYRAALGKNPDSYYLANLAGEALVEVRDLASARQEFQHVIDIVTRLRAQREDNVWTRAAMANARFVLDADEEAIKELEVIKNERLAGLESLASIERGLETLSKGLDDPEGNRLQRLKQALRD